HSVDSRNCRTADCRLVHGADNFAADAAPARLVAGHHALRGGDDRDAEAVLDAGQLVLAAVDAQAGLAHPLDLADRRALVVGVLQPDRQRRIGLAFLPGDLDAVDVAFLVQD